MSDVKRVFNYHFSKPDPRNKKFKTIMHSERLQDLKPEVDLCVKSMDTHGVMPPVYDQLDEGSCTANAGVAHKEFLDARYVPRVPMSRQFLYAVERLEDGDFGQDGGSTLAMCADRLLNVGVCTEKLWPYTQADEFKKPSKACYDDAAKHKIGAFYQLNGQYEMQKCLSNGFPFLMGMIVPKQLMGDDFNGVLPKLTPEDVLVEDGYPAGHAVLCVGYKPIGDVLYFKIRNSWGVDYADHGYFWMQALDMADPDWVSDCFTLRLARQRGM